VKTETQHSNLHGKPAAGVFQQGKRQLHKPFRTTTSMTNLDREAQKIQKRPAKPLARLKYKWKVQKKSTRISQHVKVYCNQLLSMNSHQKIKTSVDTIGSHLLGSTSGFGPEPMQQRSNIRCTSFHAF